MRLPQVASVFPEIEPLEIVGWVERHWVRPSSDEAGEWIFSEVDVARVRLVADLRHDLAVPEDAMGLVLSLLDQVYTLRRQVRDLAGALQQLPQGKGR